ncbi:MAG: RagB/SusD family nutrient uptake outer membrane protein [Balneolales bacterium]
MKKLKYLMIVISFSLIGCDGLLDKSDPTATTFVEFFNDEEDLRRVTYSTYVDYFASGDRRLVHYMHEGKSDNAYSRIDSDHHQQVANGSLSSNSRLAEYYYTISMKHIGRLNTYIDNIDVPYVEDEDIRNRYQSVLEGLRVWHYFKLTDRFGDIPFLLDPADLDDARQPPVPKEEIVQTLLAMGDDIAERLPPEQTTSNAYMFHKQSFLGILMRHSLYNGFYEEVIDYAQEIINTGDYELHPNYGDLFQYTAHDSNNEFIKINDDDARGGRNTLSFRDLGPHFRTGNGQSYLVPTKSLVDSYWTLQGRSIDNDDVMGNSKENYELDPTLNRDPRYEASIMGHGDIFYGEVIDIYNPNNPMFHENTRASASGYWFRKYVSEDDAFRNGGSFEYGTLRYAEVLLSYAEAKIMLNEIDGVTKGYINDVRERAGLDMTEADVTLPYYDSYTQDDWIELIRNERRIEFAAEGLRYDDIIRWGIAEDVLNEPALGHTREVNGNIETLHIEDRSFAQHNYLWPFHQSSIKVEPELEQNSGY